MSSRAPRRAPACPALRSRTLQHCGPAGFSRDASKGRNQVSREGSRHVPGCTEEPSRQCQELGQLLGSAAQPEENPAGKLRTWAVPELPPLQELLLLHRPLFANPAAHRPALALPTGFVSHHQILSNQPGGLGQGDPRRACGEEGSQRKTEQQCVAREFPPHREGGFGQDSSRLEQPTPREHIGTTQGTCSLQPGQTRQRRPKDWPSHPPRDWGDAGCSWALSAKPWHLQSPGCAQAEGA